MAEDGIEDMDLTGLDVPWAEDEAAKRYNVLRWAAVVLYIAAVTGLSLLPLLAATLDTDLSSNIYMVIVIGGALALIAVLARPVQGPADGVDIKDGSVSGGGVVRKLRPGETYHVRIQFKLILYVVVPVIVLMAVLIIVIPDNAVRAINGTVTVFLVILAAVFMNFEVRADREILSFKFSRFGRELPLDSISSISVTKVNAMRDFLGYGVRIGPDGTVGYILQGDAGFRVVTAEGERYVVTIPDSKGLVEHVRAAKTGRADP